MNVRFARLVGAALLALLLAACSTGPAEAGPPRFGFGFRKGTSTVTVTVPALGVTYDTSIGNGVDTAGFASLPLRSGAFRYYVNSSTGADTNTCTQAKSATTPKASIASAVSCVVNSEGDQVLVAQGMSYSRGLAYLGDKGGFSATYPFVIESYDPADPTNEANLGRATGTTRPDINMSTGADNGGGFVQGPAFQYRVLRGLKLNGNDVAGAHILVGTNSGTPGYFLFENNDFASTEVDVQSLNGAYPPRLSHIIFRNNSFHDAWATDGHGQGMYVASIDGLTAEDNAFIHAGWKRTALRTDSATIGGPSIFGHPLYEQDDVINSVVRRNVFSDTITDSGELKGGGIYQANLSIANPLGGWFGDGNNYSIDSPFGVYADGSYNAFIGAGWGYETKDIRQSCGCGVHHNAFAHSDTSFGYANYGLMADDAPDLSGPASAENISLPSYPTFDHNVLYQWGAPDQGVHLSSSTGLVGDIHATYTNNSWGDVSSGSNVNNTSASFANAYTSSSLATALGYANLAAAQTAWKADPQLHGWRTGPSLFLAGYGVIDPGLVDLTTNMALTAGYTNSGQFIGTHDGSTLTFASLPTGVTGDTNCRCWRNDGTGTTSSGTFSVTETPPTGPPHTTNIAWSISPRPVLSSLSATPGSTTATASVSTNTGSGKLFWTVMTSSTAPDWAQIRANINGDQTSYGVAHGSQSVSATGSQAISSITGLSASTAYWAYVAQLDSGNNPSLTSAASFTTTSAGLPVTGGSLVLDFTHLDSSHLFTDTGCTTALTTDLQTAKCIKDTTSGIVATNATGWIYHANSGKPYLAMDGSTFFGTTTSVAYGDANGVWAAWVTANISVAGLEDLLSDGSLNRLILPAPGVPTTNAWVRDSSGTQLAQDNNGASPLNTDEVFSLIMTGTSGSGTVDSRVDNVGDGTTAYTGAPRTSSTLVFGTVATGKFYGAAVAKGDQTANETAMQTAMAGLHP